MHSKAMSGAVDRGTLPSVMACGTISVKYPYVQGNAGRGTLKFPALAIVRVRERRVPGTVTGSSWTPLQKPFSLLHASTERSKLNHP